MIDPASRARLEGWKSSLLGPDSDSQPKDPLLSVAPSRTCIALLDADPFALAAAIAGGASVVLDSDGADPTQHRVHVARPPAELARDLVGIERAARARLAQDGSHVLWLGLGALVWADREGMSHAAPLWLVPVELERMDVDSDGSPFRVVAAPGVEPSINLALVAKLRRDFELLFSDDATTLAAVIERAEGVAVTRPGWRVERVAYLGLFSLASAIVWHDIEALGDGVLANTLVAHLACGGDRSFLQPDAAAAGAVTGAPPPDLLAPLDADDSQLRVVAAAAAGATFAVQGPPGTGKSQTIANLIVHAVSAGKTVLFASSKRGALDAVQQRLGGIGLGDFCLDLGSRRPRRAIVSQLARVLERAFRPGTSFGASADSGRLAELRAILDGHASALHRVGPFGHSLHEVLGRLVELKSTPCAQLADRDAVGLDAAKLARRKTAVIELARVSVAVEPVASHPWRLSQLSMVDSPDALHDRALAALDEAAAAGDALAAAVREVAALVPGLVGRTREQLVALGTLAAAAAASPRPGAELLTHLRGGRRIEVEQQNEQIALVRARGSGSIDTPRDPQAFLALATRHRQLAKEVDDWFTDAIEDIDTGAAWSQLRKWTESVGPVRFVALRTIRTQVKAAAQPGQLQSDESMIAALEAAIAERACRAALLAAAEPARRWFGDLGTDLSQPGALLLLDLEKIEAAVAWASELRRLFESVELVGGEAGRQSAWRALVAQVAASASSHDDLAVFARLAEAVARWQPALATLASATGIDARALGNGDDPRSAVDPRSALDHLASLREQIETLRHSVDAFAPWVAFHGAREAALVAGVGPAVQAIERGDIAASELADAWERATLLAWAEAELAETPALARFHGAQHHAHLSAFADLDRASLALERSRALARLAERVPRVARSRPPNHQSGPAVLDEALLAEVALLQAAAKHDSEESKRSLRELFAALPTLLPKLAPCMLVTPQDIAQHLPLPDGKPLFDIVVFDEAERLPTAVALSALARGTSAVIVGDSQLLAERDNLLDDSIAAKLPVLSLAWHYQSKHEELVAFASTRYYENRLQVFPAAQPSSDLGVVWRRVDGGIYEATLGENRPEAEAIVAEALARLRDPAQRARSIGIVTFTEGQRALIEDLLDEARANEPALDVPLWPDGSSPVVASIDPLRSAEPVVVKTAGAMQGEVRDVVLVSIAGQPNLVREADPDATARMSLEREDPFAGFGPLWQPGGERHLAVAITRAREQLVVFSSFGPDDVDLDSAPRGLADVAALLSETRTSGRPDMQSRRPEMLPASPIMAALGRALAERGWTVRHQVGVGAYRIDLAVVDPNDADRYVLAIEHDGPAYASATTARDRDRIRPQILATLGWRVHRVWSLDWWTDAEHEIQRAHGAIITAVAASRHRRTTLQPTTTTARKRTSIPPTATTPGTGTGTAGTAMGAAGAPGTPGAAARAASNPVIRIPPKRDESGPVIAAGSGPTAANVVARPTTISGRETTAPAASTADAIVAAANSGPTWATGSRPTSWAGVRRGEILIGPYTVAAIPAGRRAPDDLFAPRHLAELGKVVEQVLAAEAPMHVELLARRVGAYFGIGRVTQRVTEQVRSAIAGRGRFGDEADIVWRLDQDPTAVPPVRVAPNDLGSTTWRDIAEVPLCELAAAVRIVVERAPNIGTSSLVRDTARLLGFPRLTDKVNERIAIGVQSATERDLIEIENGRAMLP